MADTTNQVAGEAKAATPERRIRKERQGIVVSAKREKTVTVLVKRRVRHSRYGKIMERHRKYSVHDTMGCQEGDVVRIEETRPISKTKCWRVVEKLKKGQ